MDKFFTKKELRGVPWRKYRMGIYSESTRTIPIHTDIRIWDNANHSEPIRKTPGESIGLKFIPSKWEVFRFILISVSEQIRKTYYNSFDEKRSKIIPT